MANQKNQAPVKSATPTKEDSFAFGKINYILLIVGIVLLAIGYICLTGGGSDDPNVFNNALFDTRRLVVAPILIVGGLVVEIFAIMIKPKEKEQVQDLDQTLYGWSMIKRKPKEEEKEQVQDLDQIGK